MMALLPSRVERCPRARLPSLRFVSLLLLLLLATCLQLAPVTHAFPRLHLLKRVYGKLIHRARFLPHRLRYGRYVKPGDVATCPPPKYFYFFANTKVSGIHTALTNKNTVIILDRTDVNNTNEKFPSGSPQAGKTVYAEEMDFASKTFRPLDVKTNVFCSTGASIEDGTILSIGGLTSASNIADPMLNGSFSIRSFTPCDSASATCDFTLVGNMTTKRWYPTAQLLPDGRVMVVGGANVFGNLAINTPQTNNPTYEFWPRAPGEGNYGLSLLTDPTNLPFNLYPFVHLLPSGNVFIFAGQSSIILDYTTNQVVSTLPILDQLHPRISPFKRGYNTIFRTYPVAGTSAMFNLDPAKGYKATIMICGGSYRNATVNIKVQGNSCPSCGVVATDICASINPEDLIPTWTYEHMTTPRVMPEAILLLDDVILITNGAKKGFQGLKPQYASQFTRWPLLYDTTQRLGKRFTEVREDTKVNRAYHSSALLMPDGTVLISGSNPNGRLVPLNPKVASELQTPTEFRTHIFAPHYLQWCVSRNNLTQVPSSITIGSTFQVSLSTFITTPFGLLERSRFRVVLAHPGFSTHGSRHGMRNVILEVQSLESTLLSDGLTISYTLTVSAPPDANKAPPTYYWLSVLDQAGFRSSSTGLWTAGKWVPNSQGQPVRVMRADGVVSSAVREARITRWDIQMPRAAG